MDYFKPQTLDLLKVRFSAHGGQYHGEGILRWDPNIGFTVEAQAQRYGSVPPRTATDAPEVIPVTKVYLWPDIFRCKGAISAQAIWLTPLQRIEAKEFRVQFALPSITFFYQGEPDWKSRFYTGEFLFRISDRFVWPDRVQESTSVGDRDIGTKRSLTGLQIQDGEAEVVGRVMERERFEGSWSLPKDTYSGAQARRFSSALRYALALSTNQTIVPLRTVLRVGPHWREFVCRTENPRPLAPLNILGKQRPNRQLIWKLTSFLAQDTREASAIRVIFDRAAEIAEVGPRHAKELLASLILEGMLRTFDERPFIPGDRWDRQKSMKLYRRKYFGCDRRWKQRFARADEVLMRLRNPRAHPDWLSDRSSVQDIVQATDDLTYLSWFYGRLILRMVGETPDPTPPPPLSQQRGWITAANTANPE